MGHEPVVYDEGRPTAAQAAYIALVDPAFALALIVSLRAMAADHRQDPPGGFSFSAGNCLECSCSGALAATDCIGTVDYPCRTLRNVLSIWNGHPDYDEEWKP